MAAGVLGLSPRSYLLASLVGRSGKYFLEAVLVLALGETVRTLGEVELYTITGIIALVAIIAYLFRRRWMPSQWRITTN